MCVFFLCFFFFLFFFSDYLHESICYGYSFELHRQADAIQMGTHNICIYKKSRQKKYNDSNLKTTELLDCAHIGVCAVIRPNTVFHILHITCYICCRYSVEAFL